MPKGFWLTPFHWFVDHFQPTSSGSEDDLSRMGADIAKTASLDQKKPYFKLKNVVLFTLMRLEVKICAVSAPRVRSFRGQAAFVFIRG